MIINYKLLFDITRPQMCKNLASTIPNVVTRIVLSPTSLKKWSDKNISSCQKWCSADHNNMQ